MSSVPSPNAPWGGELPWQWHERWWRSVVDKLRAGRSHTPTAWPGGTRVAVLDERIRYIRGHDGATHAELSRDCLVA